MLSFSFRPTAEGVEGLDYIPCDNLPNTPKPSVPTIEFDLSSLAETGAIKHIFAPSGPKARPVWLDVNGRRGRRAVCVLYGDGIRYDVLDLDVAVEEWEEEEEEEGDDEEEEEEEGEEGNDSQV